MSLKLLPGRAMPLEHRRHPVLFQAFNEAYRRSWLAHWVRQQRSLQIPSLQANQEVQSTHRQKFRKNPEP